MNLPRRWSAVVDRQIRRSRRAPTALVVPVSEAGALRPRDGQGGGAGPLPPHVTVLYPFLPPRQVDAAILGDLSELFAPVASFGIKLKDLTRLAAEVLCVLPESPAPFIELTERVWRRWPDHPPYRGRFETIVPHLTVLEGPEPAGLADELVVHLPIEAAATSVELYAQASAGGWVQLASFPLAGT